MPGRGVSLTALALVAGIAAGCGGDEAPPDTPAERRLVRSAIERSFVSKSPANECAAYTERLVREVYRSERGCRLAARPSSLEPETVRVSAMRLAGERARARVALTGNGLAGLAGTLGLVEHDGEWRVDTLGADLLRATLVTALRGPAFAGEPVLSSRATRACVREDLDALPASRVRAVAYNWMRAGEQSGATFIERVLRPCLVRQRAGRALLRTEFEAGVRQAGRRTGQEPDERRCVIAQLRRTLSSRLIAEDAIRAAESVAPPIDRAIVRATRDCT